MQQMRLTRSFIGLLTFGLSLMPIAARADVAALFADLDGAQPNRGLAQMMVIGIAEGFDTVNDQLKASQRSRPEGIDCATTIVRIDPIGTDPPCTVLELADHRRRTPQRPRWVRS